MAIQRMTASDEARRSSIVTFERHVKSVLGARLSALEKLSKQLAIVNAPLAALIRNDERAMAALHELSPLVDAERKRLRGVRGNRPRNNRMFSLHFHQLYGFGTTEILGRRAVSPSMA